MPKSRLLFVVAALAVFGGTALAGVLPFPCEKCPKCGHKVCCPEPTVEKVKDHYFTFECKDICVPRVSGPCKPCCTPPKCGFVRTVKVLKKVEFECEKCGYEWKVHHACESCRPR
jgi:hypothetical protein